MNYLFPLLFFTGIVPFIVSVPLKYYLIKQGKSWSEARSYCQVAHTDLATIENDDNMLRLQDEAQSQQFSSSAWIGLYNDINSWRWSFRNETLGLMKQWCANEPDRWRASEYCVFIYYDCWSDRRCDAFLPFLCFDDRYSGTARYILIPNYKTWHEAQSYCRTYHTDLASSRDLTEHSDTEQNIPASAWIGLSRDSWKWIDQTPFFNINWMAGEPNNYMNTESCVSLYNSQASDKPCTDIKPFFCHGVITGKKQIIRIKIDSSVDMNDPAAILENIKLILMKNGMTKDVMVKWRYQPGGVVFKKNTNAHISKCNPTCPSVQEHC